MMDNRMTDECAAPDLLPCPFCGGTDAFVERLDYSASYVQCDSSIDEHSVCLARGPVGVQDDDGEEIPGAAAAIRAWNEQAARRAPVAALAADGLPELPEQTIIDHHIPTGLMIRGYTTKQMHQYALDAIAAEHLTRASAVRAASSAYQDHRKEED